MKKYSASKGGHSPGHLREAFETLVEEENVFKKADDLLSESVQEIFFDETPRTVGWLLGQLWNCTDIMPSGLCGDLGLLYGSTYAMGVRFYKSNILD